MQDHPPPPDDSSGYRPAPSWLDPSQTNPVRPERIRSDRSGWEVIGILAAVVCVLLGLVLVGLVISFVTAMNSWGKNK
ncbi:ABC-type Fe3+ transport system permease subunit [Streptacidiphilus sp. MAP12-33]|uniref:hypothetical protein n=1 Tax=Streptacidiphilus sp. MAP12-33 TaxID=3156266 RepID=UPI0035197E10